jgi:hypothetical protein
MGFFIRLTFILIIATQFLPGQSSGEKKSVGGALLRSLAVPGWGEYYAENYTAATWTFAAEITVWASYFYLNSQSQRLGNDYRSLAVTYAGVSSTDRSDAYWIHVGEAENIYEHNRESALNRNADAVYRDTDTYYWYWQDEQKFRDYNHLRVRSGRLEEYAQLVVAGAILTRLVSSVLAVRSVRRYNRALTENQDLGLAFHVQPILDSSARWIPVARMQVTF